MKYKISEICSANMESYSLAEKWEYVNYLDTGNITQNRIDLIQHIDLTKERLPSRAKRKVKCDDIIYSTVRPNQLHYGIIKDIPDNFLVSTGFTTLRINKRMADPQYIYYYLTLNDVTKHLSALAEQSTSAYPSIKSSDIEKIVIDLPNIITQKRVSRVLSLIDDKIELNNKINENLRCDAA